MSQQRNLSLLAIVLFYFVQKCSMETEIPTTTTVDDLTTTDFEDLFRPYEAQYPQQSVGDVQDDNEFQNDEKVEGVLEGIDRVIVSIEKVVNDLQRKLHDGPEPVDEIGEEVQRSKRIPDDKNLWDMGQLVEKTSKQMILLNRLQRMKKIQLRAVNEFMSARNAPTNEEKPQSAQDILKEFTLKAKKKKDFEKPKPEVHEDSEDPFRDMGAFLKYFAPTSTTPAPTQIKNKSENKGDNKDNTLDRHVRSIDSQFFKNLASYLMSPFSQSDDTQNVHVKREIDDHTNGLDEDAHNDLENDVLVTPQQIPEDLSHAKSESPLIESIQAIPDPEVRLEFTKDIQPKIEGLEKAVEEPRRPIHLTVVDGDGTVLELTESPKVVEEIKKISSIIEEILKIEDMATEDPQKTIFEQDIEPTTTILPEVTTISEEIHEKSTAKSVEYVSERENEVFSRESLEVPEKEYVKELRTRQEVSEEKDVAVTTESVNEFTTLPNYEETTLHEEDHHIVAEDKFEEAIMQLTTPPTGDLIHGRISAKYSADHEVDALEENIVTDTPTEFPIVEETTTWEYEEQAEAEPTTPPSFEEKVNSLKKELEKKSPKSSSSSSSEESSSSSSSSTSESDSGFTTTMRSESVNEETLSKNELYDLLSKPVNQPASSESVEDKNHEAVKKEARSRSLDVSKTVIVSQSPEEISTIEEDTKPEMDNHVVHKKEGVSREFHQDVTATTEIPASEGRSFSGETIEEALESVVAAVDIVMETKKSLETFPETVAPTEEPPSTDRPLASTKNTRDLVGLGRDDSSLGLEESLPLDRTLSEDSAIVVTSATSAIVAVILVLGIGVFAVMRTRVHGGLDLAAV